MYTGKTLFAQIMDFLPWKTFHRIVSRYDGDHRIRTLPCAEHFRALAFAQLTYRESLRDIEACLSAQSAKLYHMGIGSPIKRSTLADANERRDWRIYAEFAQRLITQARKLYAEEDLGLDLPNTVYALDSTTIDLCLSLFPWAPFRSHQGRSEDAYAVGPARKYTEFYTCFRRQAARCQRARFDDSGAYGDLRDGPCLSRFRAALRTCTKPAHSLSPVPNRIPTCDVYTRRRAIEHKGIICDQTVALSGFYSQKQLPPSSAPDSLQRSRVWEDTHLSDQPVWSSTSDHLRTIQSPVASPIIFQMDQATSPHQKVLRHVRERRESANLDRRVGICAHVAIIKKRLNLDVFALHFVTGVFSHLVRENPFKRRTFSTPKISWRMT